MVCDNYGRLTSIALDPIEKKPLAMYMPGSLILSVGSYGCNLNCSFCQNHEISRAHAGSVPWREVSPRQLCDLALEYRPHGNIGVAFTYNEPLVSMEYLLDTAALLHEADMKVVLVSNGSVSEAAAREVIPHIDAMNIDLKGFTDEYYRDLLSGDRQVVMRFIERAVKDCHVELTTLIIPGKNDSEDEMRELSLWVAGLGRDIPLHITRFYPRFHMTDREATDIACIYRLVEAAKENLSYVYPGNC